MRHKRGEKGPESRVAEGIAPRKKAASKDLGDARDRETKALRRKLQQIDSRLTAMTAQIEDIKAGPVDRFVAQAVAELEEGPWGEVLTELVGLDEAEEATRLEATDLFDQLKMLRLALFSALGIRPCLLQKTVRMPTARALSCRWGGHAPMPTTKSCTFEVISPGWMRGDTVLLPPKIRQAKRPARATRIADRCSLR